MKNKYLFKYMSHRENELNSICPSLGMEQMGKVSSTKASG